MNTWHKFHRLPPDEKLLFLRAIFFLLAARLGLRILGMGKLRGLMGRVLRPKQATGSGRDETSYRAIRAARLVSVAARYTGGTCLAQSIVLASLLRRQGIPAELRIGVRKREDGVEAHAWVEAAGKVLNDGQDVSERYAAFERDFSLAGVNWR